MAGPGNILIRVGADTGAAVRELGNIKGPLSDVQTHGEKMGAGIRKATLPAIAVLGALGAAAGAAAKAAAEDAAGQDALAGALERVAGATQTQIAAAETYIGSLSRQTGIADDELRPALAKLASATGDVGKAQDQLALAVDIAAASGKSLETVSKALASADDGHTRSLQKLVPGLDEATLKTGNMSKITADLADKVGGAATRAADTATGRYRVMQVQMGELQESLGTALIPVISKLSEVLLKATDFASQHTTAIKVVIAAVAGLAAGILVLRAGMIAYNAIMATVRVATAAWSAAQVVLNLALTANPIGLVIVAVAALAAGIVIAYKHSETFRNVISKVWEVIKVTSPIYVAVAAFNALSGAVSSVVGWISRIHFPSPPSWLGKVGGLFGGSSNGGEFGARRAGAGARSLIRGSGPRSAGPSSSSSGAPININIYGAIDPEGTARAVQRVLAGHARRQGFAT